MDGTTINDLFLQSMCEYSVSDEATNNGWATLLQCVIAEFGNTPEYAALSCFFKDNEKAYKDKGNALPAAYRSSKSTIMSAVKWAVALSPTEGKTALATRTKVAREEASTEEVLSPERDFVKQLDVLKNKFDAMDTFQQAAAFTVLKRTFGIPT